MAPSGVIRWLYTGVISHVTAVQAITIQKEAHCQASEGISLRSEKNNIAIRGSCEAGLAITEQEVNSPTWKYNTLIFKGILTGRSLLNMQQ